MGKTIKRLCTRLSRHIWEANHDTTNNYKSRWIRAMLSAGYTPTITLVGEVDGDGCAEEIAHIDYFKSELCDLVNTTLGGEGTCGRVVSQAVRDGIRNKLLGHTVSATTRLKISRAKLGRRRPHTAATRLKIGLANSGKKRTQAQRVNISNAHKGQKIKEATRLKLSLAVKAYYVEHPDARRERCAETRARWEDPECSAVLRASMKTEV